MISTIGDAISTVEELLFCGGIPSVNWKIRRTVEGYNQYCGDNQYCVEIRLLLFEIPSVLWRDNIQYYGGCSELGVGGIINTLEAVQYF